MTCIPTPKRADDRSPARSQRTSNGAGWHPQRPSGLVEIKIFKAHQLVNGSSFVSFPGSVPRFSGPQVSGAVSGYQVMSTLRMNHGHWILHGKRLEHPKTPLLMMASRGKARIQFDLAS